MMNNMPNGRAPPGRRGKQPPTLASLVSDYESSRMNAHKRLMGGNGNIKSKPRLKTGSEKSLRDDLYKI
eukprot:m.321130 g.321130  ORF g.321130 m.321130 type:complete len:69 (-) comp16526_c0_seq18:759-965(-)